MDFVDIIQDEVHVFIESDNNSFKSHIDNVIQPDLKLSQSKLWDDHSNYLDTKFLLEEPKKQIDRLDHDLLDFMTRHVRIRSKFNSKNIFIIFTIFRNSIHPNFILDNKKLIESALSGSNFDLSCCPHDNRSDSIFDFDRIKILFMSSPQSKTKQYSKTDEAILIISFRLFPSRQTKLIARNILHNL